MKYGSLDGLSDVLVEMVLWLNVEVSCSAEKGRPMSTGGVVWLIRPEDRRGRFLMGRPAARPPPFRSVAVRHMVRAQKKQVLLRCRFSVRA